MEKSNLLFLERNLLNLLEKKKTKIKNLYDAMLRQQFKYWEGSFQKEEEKSNAPHEAGMLNLDISKSLKLLNWKPIWDFEKTIEKTISWYMKFYQGENPSSLCKADLKSYMENLEN